MNLNRKKIISIFLLILLSGSVFGLAANVLMQPKNPNGEMSNIVVMETNMGAIEIELNREKAPITVENFVNYVESGFYEGLCFHRIIEGFMVQGGGYYPNGTYKMPGEPIEIESDNGLKNLRGTIAMARSSDPNSATSQFFINTQDNTDLDYPSFDGYGYTVFGKVTSGMDIVDAIEEIETEVHEVNYPMYNQSAVAEDWPIEPVEIIEAYMKEG